MFAVVVENAFNFLSTEYVELFHASGATAFQQPVWLQRFYGSLVQSNAAQPLIIVVRDGDGALLMVLPLVRRRYGIVRVVEFADLRVADYTAAVSPRAQFSRILADSGALQKIRRLLRPSDLLRLKKLQESDLPLATLFGIAEPSVMTMSAYAVPLASTFDAWRTARMDRSYVRELDKKRRQLNRKGDIRFGAAATPEDIRKTFDAMREYRKLRFEGRHGVELLQRDPYFDFYLGVATDGRDSVARTYSMTMDGRPIACVFGMSHNSRFLVLLSAFDQVNFKNQSLGALTFEQVAEDCIARGDTILDFTIGDEAYKLTFGATPAPIWQASRALSPLGWLAQMLVERAPQANALAKLLVHGAAKVTPAGPIVPSH